MDAATMAPRKRTDAGREVVYVCVVGCAGTAEAMRAAYPAYSGTRPIPFRAASLGENRPCYRDGFAFYGVACG